MNNREWLTTLGDTEAENERFDTIIDLIRKYDINIATVKYFAWLEAEHTTTADEDFAEHDYFKAEQNEYVVIYKSGKIRDDNTEVYVYPKETKILVFPKNEVRYVHLEDNQIRIIADKKRKEVWG